MEVGDGGTRGPSRELAARAGDRCARARPARCARPCLARARALCAAGRFLLGGREARRVPRVGETWMASPRVFGAPKSCSRALGESCERVVIVGMDQPPFRRARWRRPRREPGSLTQERIVFNVFERERNRQSLVLSTKYKYLKKSQIHRGGWFVSADSWCRRRPDGAFHPPGKRLPEGCACGGNPGGVNPTADPPFGCLVVRALVQEVQESSRRSLRAAPWTPCIRRRAKLAPHGCASLRSTGGGMGPEPVW